MRVGGSSPLLTLLLFLMGPRIAISRTCKARVAMEFTIAKCEVKDCEVSEDCPVYCMCPAADANATTTYCVLPDTITTDIYSVNESALPDTQVMTFPELELESWAVSYSVPEMANYFTLRLHDGQYRLVVTRTPDLEDILYRYKKELSTFMLTLECSKTGKRNKLYDAITVHVVPENEFAPSFMNTPFIKNVLEDTKVGTELLPLSHYTMDKDVTPGRSQVLTFKLWPYSGKPGIDGRPYFRMPRPHIGAISLGETLDYEALKSKNALFMHLNVSAADSHGRMTFTTVTLEVKDVDDLPPEFYDPQCPDVSPKIRPCMVSYMATICVNFTGEVTDVTPEPIRANDLDTLGYSMTYSLEAGPGLSLENLRKVHINHSGLYVVEAFQDVFRLQFALIATENSSNAHWSQVPLIIVVEEETTTVEPTTTTTTTTKNPPQKQLATTTQQDDLVLGNLQKIQDSLNDQKDDILDINNLDPLFISTISLAVLLLVAIVTGIVIAVKKRNRSKIKVHPSNSDISNYQVNSADMTARGLSRADLAPDTSMAQHSTKSSRHNSQSRSTRSQSNSHPSHGPFRTKSNATASDDDTDDDQDDPDDPDDKSFEDFHTNSQYGTTRNNNISDPTYNHSTTDSRMLLNSSMSHNNVGRKKRQYYVDDHGNMVLLDNRRPRFRNTVLVPSSNVEYEIMQTDSAHGSNPDSSVFPAQLSFDNEYNQSSPDEEISGIFESSETVNFEQVETDRLQIIRQELKNAPIGDQVTQNPSMGTKVVGKLKNIVEGTYNVLKGSDVLSTIHSGNEDSQSLSKHDDTSEKITGSGEQYADNNENRHKISQDNDGRFKGVRPRTSDASCTSRPPKSPRRVSSARSGGTRPSTAHLGQYGRHSSQLPGASQGCLDGCKSYELLDRVAENFDYEPVVREVRYVVRQKPPQAPSPKKPNASPLPKKHIASPLPKKENASPLPKKQNASTLPHKQNASPLAKKQNASPLQRKHNTPQAEQHVSEHSENIIHRKGTADSQSNDTRKMPDDDDMRTSRLEDENNVVAEERSSGRSTRADGIQMRKNNEYKEHMSSSRKQKSRVSFHDSESHRYITSQEKLLQPDSPKKEPHHNSTQRSKEPQQNTSGVRQIKIKSGVLKRLTKEKQMYERETAETEARIAGMKRAGNDEYGIKKQEEVLGESRSMVHNTHSRLQRAYSDLTSLLHTEQTCVDTEEYAQAQEALAVVEELLE